MKNWIKGLLVGILALGLAACADTADVKTGTDATNKSDLTIEDVFNKAQEVSEKQESMHTSANIEQNISSEAIGIDMESTIKMEMDMIIDPLAMHQVMEMNIGQDDVNTLKTEIYMTEDGLFMKEPMTDAWMSLPGETIEEVSASLGVGTDSAVDLASLEKFVEDFKFEQDDEQYILSLKGSGEKFQELMKSELESTGVTAGMGEDESEILENMVVHQLDYEIFIDKKTFHITSFNLTMDMELGIEEEAMRIVQNIATDISQINDIKEIAIPKEVVDSAMEQ